jgi:hypothetical protein
MAGFFIFKNPDNFNVSEEPFKSGEEAQFEELLESCPEAVPISEINPSAKVAIPIGRQVTTNVGPIDLLFLDDTGRLLVIECKLIENPEARREVISQLIEYSSRVQASWDLNRVLSIAEEYFEKRGQRLIDQMRAALTKSGEESNLTEKLLKTRIARYMKEPYLVIAANRLQQRALVLSDFLRKVKVPLICLEIRRYRVGTTWFLTGQVKSASLLIAVSSGQRTAISEEEWLLLTTGKPQHDVRANLLQWAKSLAEEGIATIRVGSKELMIETLVRGKEKVKILSISEHHLWFYFAAYRQLGMQEPELPGLRKRISEAVKPATLSPGNDFASIHLSSLNSDEKLETLKSFLSRLIKDLIGKSAKHVAS